MRIKNEDGLGIVKRIAVDIEENKDYLSEIDGAAGDGDHGINMTKGFLMALDNIDDNMSVSTAFRNLGITLLEDIGGSMGPIYGRFFMKMAGVFREKEYIDEIVFSEALESARQGIVDLAGAQRGDKTLLDTLIPAADAYRRALETGKDFREALENLKTAAKDGMEETKDMEAKVGRAARLGKRSIGIIDAGAASCYLILRSIADSICERLD